LQTRTRNGSTWSLAYTVAAGRDLVADTVRSGTIRLSDQTGAVVIPARALTGAIPDRRDP
jgi:hypothetical protein